MTSALRRPFGLLISMLVVLLVPLVALAQQPATKPSASWAGKYEGTGKGPNGDVRMTLELFEATGNFSGNITTASGTYEIVKGQLVDNVLTLELRAKESAAKLSLHQKEDKLVGELSVGLSTGAIEFKRLPKDEITGEWDGAADAQGQPFPFTLTLKLEGEKVSGSSKSDFGDSPISSGIWKDGKLAIVLESGSGQIGLIATLQDGKLVGDYDFAGQFQGKWVAVKKK